MNSHTSLHCGRISSVHQPRLNAKALQGANHFGGGGGAAAPKAARKAVKAFRAS